MTSIHKISAEICFYRLSQDSLFWHYDARAIACAIAHERSTLNPLAKHVSRAQTEGIYYITVERHVGNFHSTFIFSVPPELFSSTCDVTLFIEIHLSNNFVWLSDYLRFQRHSIFATSAKKCLQLKFLCDDRTVRLNNLSSK